MTKTLMDRTFGRLPLNNRLLALMVSLVVLVCFAACSAPPDPEIVGTWGGPERVEHSDGSIAYIVWLVSCTVYNDGGAGEIEVSATIEDGRNFSKKRLTMHLDSEEEREHIFSFRNVGFLLLDSYHEFNCQAVPK